MKFGHNLHQYMGSDMRIWAITLRLKKVLEIGWSAEALTPRALMLLQWNFGILYKILAPWKKNYWHFFVPCLGASLRLKKVSENVVLMPWHPQFWNLYHGVPWKNGVLRNWTLHYWSNCHDVLVFCATDYYLAVALLKRCNGLAPTFLKCPPWFSAPVSGL